MKRDDTGSASVFYVEENDELHTLFEQLRIQPSGEKEGVVIVLPAYSTRAFQSPRDFHELKIFRRQGELPIIFVIPKQGVAQWARTNNFAVFPSLDALLRATSFRIARPDEMQAQFGHEMPLQRNASAARPSSPGFRDIATRVPNPATPLPPIDDAFLEAAMLSFPQPQVRTYSQPLKTEEPLPIPTTPDVGVEKQQARRSTRLWLSVIMVIVVLSAALSGGILLAQKNGNPLVNPQISAPTNGIVGHLYFLNSGQVNETGSAGIDDQIELSLSSIAPPGPGTNYYGWLRSDLSQSDGPFMPLGQLQVSHGKVTLQYADPQHKNLLASMSQFLITAEDASIQPTIPTLNHNNWIYNGIIPQVPDPKDTANHYSYLDHVRHLLADDPTLDTFNLSGGLAFWLDKNVAKVHEWASAAADDPDPASIHRHMVRILDYLDGIKDVNQDVPAGTPWLVDQHQGAIGLLEIRAGQNPRSLLDHIGFHLNSLITAPGAGSDQQKLASKLVVAMNSVNTWLDTARSDAKQLVTLVGNQLQQPQARTLLNDLLIQTTNAQNGYTDPATGNVENGEVWLHTVIQGLGVINITAYKS